jgi:hypothetical protein
MYVGGPHGMDEVPAADAVAARKLASPINHVAKVRVPGARIVGPDNHYVCDVVIFQDFDRIEGPKCREAQGASDSPSRP